MKSLGEFATGIDRIEIINDAPNPFEHNLSQYGHQTFTGGAGYNTAMKAACAAGAAEDGPSIWLEEDFFLTAPVDFTAIANHLEGHPYLAQIVLQRQPWFKNEVGAGNMLQPLRNKGKTFTSVGGYLEHRAFFSGNPSVWRKEVFEMGWPDGEWSEDSKRDQLLEAGFSFAITSDILCNHDGERSGKDY